VRSIENSLEENCPLSIADLGRGLLDSLSMSTMDTGEEQTSVSTRRPSNGQPRSRVNSRGDNRPSVLTGGFSQGLSDSLSMSALDTARDDDHHADTSHVQARSRVSSASDNRSTRPSLLHGNSDPTPNDATESVEGSCSPAPVVVSVPAFSPIYTVGQRCRSRHSYIRIPR
jgi:hypothetical protein